MSNKRPDIEGEMDELQRAVQDLSRDENIEISVEQLVKAFNSSKEETLTNDIWGKLENTESNEIQKGDTNTVMKIAKMYNKTSPKILAKAIVKGEYNRPLILKLGERYILVAGNTRLSTAAAMGVSPKVFIARIFVFVVDRFSLKEDICFTVLSLFEKSKIYIAFRLDLPSSQSAETTEVIAAGCQFYFD
jgi:hypothetical protein